MYVALTRARPKVVIPVPTIGSSVFVEELISLGHHVRVVHAGEAAEICPVCGKGFLMHGKLNRVCCSRPECGLGIEQRQVFCPTCKDGKLVVTQWPEGYKVHCQYSAHITHRCDHVDRPETNRLRAAVQANAEGRQLEYAKGG